MRVRTFTWKITNKRISKMLGSQIFPLVLQLSSQAPILLYFLHHHFFGLSFLNRLIGLKFCIQFFSLQTDTTQLSVPDLEILSVRSMFENQIDPN